MRKRIGIVGYGTIGNAIAKAIKEKFFDLAELTAIYDIDRKKATVSSMEELVNEVDLVVETASPQAVQEIVPKVLKKGKEILVLSTGGLLGMPLQKGIYFPSGAIAGLDGIYAASLGRIDKITLTTTKPQKSLGDKNYDKDTVIFNGKVEDAVKKFPFNINVCATLSIISQNPVMVCIVASPTIKRNVHQIDIEGDFGRMSFRMENEPSPDNPKTSYLAILSAVSALKKILYGQNSY